ncbi:MAG: hypothetical protein AB1705_21545 [Verrucomicrobiota bacterium]
MNPLGDFLEPLYIGGGTPAATSAPATAPSTGGDWTQAIANLANVALGIYGAVDQATNRPAGSPGSVGLVQLPDGRYVSGVIGPSGQVQQQQQQTDWGKIALVAGAVGLGVLLLTRRGRR